MPANQLRKWQDKGFMPFRLEVLTPVFIGSGTTLSPLEYLIRKTNGNNRLHRIDLQSWLVEHAGDVTVQKIVASGDIFRIRRMLDEKVNIEQFTISSSPIDDAALARLSFPSAIQQNGCNNFPKGKTGEVDVALRNVLDNGLYIPGSSLKGAMSTPLINWIDRLSHLSLRDCMHKDPRFGVQNRLNEMFGRISEHAMQALKVSDVSAPVNACSVITAKECSRNPEKKGTPKNPCEAIMPGCGNLWGRLMLDTASGQAAITLPKGKFVLFTDLVRQCNAFYQKRFENELNKFYGLPHFRNTRERLLEIEARLRGVNEQTMLLRIGHYSHIESVTVDNNEPFTRKGKKGTPMPFGTTRTLANGQWPFGWVMLHFCTVEEYNEGQKKEDMVRNAAISARMKQIFSHTEKQDEKTARTVQLLHEQEGQPLSRERKKMEGHQQKENMTRQLVELSQEEARLLQLQNKPSEALSVEIFNEMQRWSPELQRKAAEMLRDYWITLGKWYGRQSQKQEKKIRAVSAILT